VEGLLGGEPRSASGGDGEAVAPPPPIARQSDLASEDGDRRGTQGDSTVAVKLRLMRMGKKKQPTYRVVAADSGAGRFLEVIGFYAPRGRSKEDSEAIVRIDRAKLEKWLSRGAQPTEAVERLLARTGEGDASGQDGAG
jgi:small subunit ribosomal protein S16